MTGLPMTRLLFSLLLAIFILGETQELIAGPLSRIKSHRHQQAKRSRLRNSYQGYITKTREEGDSNQMLIKNNVPPQGFVALFNGIDLKGWYGWGTQDPQDFRNMSPEEKLEYKKKSIYGGLLNKKGVDAGDHINAHWRVDNDELVNDGKGLYLTTDKEYGDFELLVDYKMQPLGDSGIYLRGIPQVQIWDSTEEKKFKLGADRGSGGLWNNKRNEGKYPLVRTDRPFGEWNHFRIKMIGERVTVELNGEIVVQNAVMDNFFAHRKKKNTGNTSESISLLVPPVPPRGPIQLQTHGSEIRWRNIYIREISTSEADTFLRSQNESEFVELINGKDLSDWQGATDSYEVREGNIVCKPSKGGDLLTKDSFGDVTVRVEFKLPTAGNNGIALRVPEGGHSAHDGMEIQIIDDDGYNARLASAGKPGLKDYQHHGSLYFCVGAKQGYLRPAGEWNFEEIIICDQELTVTLNGTCILDVQLDTLDRSKLDHVPGGLSRKEGFIGFAGHNDPVEFRSFKVKKMN
jgi:hypothetical protein